MSRRSSAAAVLLPLIILVLAGGSSPAMAAYVMEWSQYVNGGTIATPGAGGGLAAVWSPPYWDMEGDGIPDIVVKNFAGTFIAYDGATKAQKWTYTPPVPMDLWGFWDINGDGVREAVLTRTDRYDVYVLNWHTNTIELDIRDPGGAYVNLMGIRDFDGDGKPEILVTVASTFELWGDGTTGPPTPVAELPAPAKAAAALGPTVPNPIDGAGRLSFQISRAGDMDLSVFDAAGRRIRTLRNGTAEVGSYQAEWDGHDSSGRQVAPGVYYVRLNSAGVTSETKAIVIR